jgi:hypothetical protein
MKMSLRQEAFLKVVQHVWDECLKRGVDGVFAMSENLQAAGPIHWMLIRRESPLDPASDGKNYNLLAIALSKLSIALMHGNIPAEGPRWIGETEFRGFLRSEDTGCSYAFSGGTEDQDLEIVQEAERFHAAL